MKEFDKLIEVLNILRGEKGCPWDKKQTRESLKNTLLEETYEVLEAIEIGGNELKSELGDLLLNIIFQAKISEEKKEFSIKEVIEELIDKLIRRHPHVFLDKKVKTEKEAFENWEKVKSTEKIIKKRKSVLDGIPKQLPPLLKAERIQQKVSVYGFDWKKKEDVFFKIEEELKEVKEAIKNKDKKNLEEEIGDLIFSITNYSRHMGISSHEAMEKANKKFVKRFNYIENNCNLKKSNFEILETLWKKSKKSNK